MVGDRLINAGVVDQSIDATVEPGQCRVPDLARGGWVHQIAGDQLAVASGRMADDHVAGGFEEVERGLADASARPGDEDVHAVRLAPSPSCRHGPHESSTFVGSLRDIPPYP